MFKLLRNNGTVLRVDNVFDIVFLVGEYKWIKFRFNSNLYFPRESILYIISTDHNLYNVHIKVIFWRFIKYRLIILQLLEQLVKPIFI